MFILVQSSCISHEINNFMSHYHSELNINYSTVIIVVLFFISEILALHNDLFFCIQNTFPFICAVY